MILSLSSLQEVNREIDKWTKWHITQLISIRIWNKPMSKPIVNKSLISKTHKNLLELELAHIINSWSIS